MRDIPMFTTEYGAAGLVLREIPYQNCAYVHIHYAQQPEKLLEECIGFCRAAGAEQVYAKGHDCLQRYPLHTTILKMQCDKNLLPVTDACVYPVVEQTLEQWLRIYRDKIKKVPNAAWMTDGDGKKMLTCGEGYFVHRQGVLLGIGRVQGSELQWVAAVEKGAGKDVVTALTYCIGTDDVWLTVSAENKKAIQLYASMGFMVTQELSRWYKIF